MNVKNVFVVSAIFSLIILPVFNPAQAQTETHYGIVYDLGSLPNNLSPSDLIMAVTQLNIDLDVDIAGVYVLDQGLAQNAARVVRTAPMGVEKKRHYVLMISPDLTDHPQDIKEILIHKGPVSFAEKEQEKIEQKREEAISSFFGADQMNPNEKETIPAQLAKVPINFIQSIQDLLKSHPKEQTLKGIEIYDYYLSFDQIFPKTVDVPPEETSDVYIDKQYFESGQIKQTAPYKEGKLNGTLTMYYENGHVESEWDYVDGILEGTIRLYDEDGHLKSEGSYHNGQLVSKKNYDPEGKLIYEENIASQNQ